MIPSNNPTSGTDKTNILRTHDEHVYLTDDRYEEPKEIFKVLLNIAKDVEALNEGSTVCDFGCATGEFLYFLSKEFPEALYTGYDVVPELVQQAIARVLGVEFKLGSVLQSDLCSRHSVDLAFMLGVHSIFESFEESVVNLINWTRPGGHIYVFGLFNTHPVDVWVQYRLGTETNPNHREPGWNIFSQTSVSRFIDHQIGAGKHRFIPFEMPFDLKPNPSDPIRTWTFMDDLGTRRLTNGLSLICNLEILEINP